jgi:hypothetical protein
MIPFAQMRDFSCTYQINHEDGGYTRGEVGSDKLTTVTRTVMLDRTVFGCSRGVDRGLTLVSSYDR